MSDLVDDLRALCDRVRELAEENAFLRGLTADARDVEASVEGSGYRMPPENSPVYLTVQHHVRELMGRRAEHIERLIVARVLGARMKLVEERSSDGRTTTWTLEPLEK